MQQFLENIVRQFIEENNLLKLNRQKVIIGLSGGVDSVCLLYLLRDLGYDVVCAHCNFHLRGDESDRDEMYVRQLCSKLDVELVVEEYDTAEYAKSNAMSIEMAARELRYDFFRRLMVETNAQAIAVAHHKDDNVETVLLNMVRGSGIRGICGIRPQNGDVVRPLLCVSRSEIFDYAKRKHLEYVLDSTNLIDEANRNKLRLNVIPELNRINPAASENIVRTIENLNAVNSIYRWAVDELSSRCIITKSANRLEIDTDVLLNTVSPFALLFELISCYGFNRATIEDVIDAIKDNSIGSTLYSATHTLCVDRHRVIVVDNNFFSLPLLQDVVRLNKQPVSCVKFVNDRKFAYFDADKIKQPISVRFPQKGDRFTPFGMKGTKLVSDYLTEQKLSVIDKQATLLLCDADDNILWVMGRRSSGKFMVDDSTRSVITAEFLR